MFLELRKGTKVKENLQKLLLHRMDLVRSDLKKETDKVKYATLLGKLKGLDEAYKVVGWQ